jgi:hypothetical protein
MFPSDIPEHFDVRRAVRALMAKVGADNSADPGCIEYKTRCLQESVANAPAVSGSLPAGIIVMWSGTLASVPTGWALCDGQNGTPDLRDKFVKGWAAGVDPGGTGGGSYTPAGSVSAPVFTGSSVNTSSVSAGTPAGTVSTPTFTGNSVTSSAVSAGTPAGTSTAPAFTGTQATLTHSGTAVADHAAHTHGVTSNVAVADHAAHTHTVTAAGTIAWPAGVPTFAGTAITDTVKAASGSTSVAILASPKTPAGTISWPAGVPVLTGSSVTSGNPSAALSHSVTNNAVTSGAPSATLSHAVTQPSDHTYTPAGAVAAPVFTGSALATHTHTTTATGSISTPTFTGSALAGHQHTVTAAGTNSAPTFTGTQASPEPAFYKLAFIMKV